LTAISRFVILRRQEKEHLPKTRDAREKATTDPMDSTPRNDSLLYAVDETPPLWMAFFLGLQHVLLVFSGIVFIPLIVAKGSQIPPDQIEYVAFSSIIVTAVSTLIQVLRFGRVGSGYVLFMGSSGSFIACSLAAVHMGGFALVATMALISAPLEFVFAYSLRHLRKIVTPAVGGVVIMLVSVNLIPIAMRLWVGYPGTPHYCSRENLIVGALTLAVILVLGIFGSPRVRLWSPVAGTFCGYLVAWFFGILELSHFNQAVFFGFPRGHWPGIELHLTAAHIPILVAFCITTLVGAIESTGTAMAVQRVSERKFRKIDYDRVQGCLYSDGLGNLMAGLAGTVPNTTYSSTIAVLELTGVAARRVGVFGALLLGVLAFFPKLGAIVLDMPGPVLGGSLIVFLGILFATGIQLATATELNYRSSLIVGLSLCVGIVMENKLFFHEAIPAHLDALLGNGIATGGATAFILSLVFQFRPKAKASFQLPPDETRLPDLSGFIAGLEKSLDLPGRQLFSLQLACEEVYTVICRNRPAGGAEGQVQFSWTKESDFVQVDVEAKLALEDMDAPAPSYEPQKATPDDLEQLGLVILQKVARDVEHVRIAGYNCISFKIPGAPR